MSLEFIIILLMGVAVVAFVVQPLVIRVSPYLSTDVAEQDLERLSAQKETLYTAIHDLDFDFQTGKVDREDYAAMRHRLETEAIEILQQIDRADPFADLDSKLERQILALRQPSPQHIFFSTTTVICTTCGVRLHGNENFCPACGHPQGPS
jgi:rubrerythrin